MLVREAATIWMSSMAMKKPTHMTAKAKVFLPGERSAEVASPAVAAGVVAPGRSTETADGASEVVAGGIAAAADPDARVSVAIAVAGWRRLVRGDGCRGHGNRSHAADCGGRGRAAH